MSQPLSTQALVVRSEPKSLSLEDIVIVDLQPDEILVEIVTSGICHTDLLAIDGILPMSGPGVLGHEGSVTDPIIAELLPAANQHHHNNPRHRKNQKSRRGSPPSQSGR